MSKEVKEAIKSCNLLLAGDIMLHILDDDGGTAYSGEVNKLYNKDLATVLNYIKELEEKIKLCEDTGTKLINKKTFTDNFINKQVIRDKIEELESMKLLGGKVFQTIIEEKIKILNELLESEVNNE